MWDIVKGLENISQLGSTHLKSYAKLEAFALSTISVGSESSIAHVVEMKEPEKVWSALREQIEMACQPTRDALVHVYQRAHIKPNEKFGV